MKKGFTLIELLAVIMILGIIALVAIPAVSHIIEESKEKAGARSVEAYIESINLKIMKAQLKGTFLQEGTITSLNELDISTNDEITCESYIIKKGKIKQALSCRSNNYVYDYSDSKGATLVEKNNNKQESSSSPKNPTNDSEQNNNNNNDDNNTVVDFDDSGYVVDPTRSSESIHNGGYEMPDIYSTGFLSNRNNLVPFSEKYPEAGNTITSKVVKKYGTTYEGFYLDKQLTIRAVDNITIRDFLIENSSTYGISVVAYNNEKYPENITITDGEINGTSSAAITCSNCKIQRVYIHEYGGDALKFGSNQIIEGNYIGPGGKNEGAHADGIQLTGTADNSIFKGNRLDMLATKQGYKGNAAVFLKLESGHSDNVTISYNWLNAGGYTTYIVKKEGVTGDFTNLTYSYNKLGNGYCFGYLSRDKTISVNDINTQIYMENIQVPNIGSIVYYDSSNNRINNLNQANNNMKILVNSANYTSSDLNIIVVARLYDSQNKLVKVYQTTNTIPKNIECSVGKQDPNITIDSFPVNYSTFLNINDLPGDLSNYRLVTTVYSGNYILKTKTIQ